MKEKTPLAFKIFMISCSFVIFVLLLSVLFAHYQIDKKYAILLPILLTINSSINPLGVYIGIKASPVENKHMLLNKIGLIGNAILYALFLIILIVMGIVQMR